MRPDLHGCMTHCIVLVVVLAGAAQVAGQFADYTPVTVVAGSLNIPWVGSRPPLNAGSSPVGMSGRSDVAAWKSGDSVFVFGGNGFYNESSGPGMLNDMWRLTAGQWTWLGGSTLAEQNGAYGSRGVTSPTSWPGARRLACSWQFNDTLGWLFGGSGHSTINDPTVLNDLWTVTLPLNGAPLWTWVAGSQDYPQASSYSSPYYPGSTYCAFAIVNRVANLAYVYGGVGYANGPVGDNYGYNGHLFSFDMNGVATYRNGPQDENPAAVRGTQGSCAVGNTPGQRAYYAGWSTPLIANRIFLFGGAIPPLSSNDQMMNDLWVFAEDVNQWAWLGGSVNPNTVGSYPSAFGGTGYPGARFGFAAWVGTDGAMYLFGGQVTFAALTNLGSDLWRLDANCESSVGCSATFRFKTGYTSSYYGNYPVTGEASFRVWPGARMWTTAVQLDSGRMMLVGGTGVTTDQVRSNGALADVLAFDKTCPYFDDPLNATVTPQCAPTVASVNITCQDGFRINGTGLLTCSNGQWSAPWPSCNPVSCGTLPMVAYGSAPSCTGDTLNNRCTFTCNAGFEPVDPTSVNGVVCPPSGVWPVASCIISGGKCPHPAPPANGFIDTSCNFTVGAVCQKPVTCFPNYELSSGDSPLTCLADGTLQGTIPTCKAIILTGLNIGIGVAVLVILIALVVGAVVWWKRRAKNRAASRMKFGNSADDDLTVRAGNDASEQRLLGILSAKTTQLVGSGGSADVYKAKLEDGQWVAIKKLKKTGLDDIGEFHREATLLSRIVGDQHRNVVQLIFFCNQPPCIVMELITNGNLKALLSKNSTNVRKKHDLMVQVGEGMAFLHNYKIAHLDLKPENVLMADNDVPRITDFGTSRSTDAEQGGLSTVGPFVGTPAYSAPERFFPDQMVDLTKCDVFSYAVSVWFAFTMQAPFNNMSPEKVIEFHATGGNVPLVFPIPMELGKLYSELLARCLNPDPVMRPSFRDILNQAGRCAAELPLATASLKSLNSFESNPTFTHDGLGSYNPTSRTAGHSFGSSNTYNGSLNQSYGAPTAMNSYGGGGGAFSANSYGAASPMAQSYGDSNYMMNNSYGGGAGSMGNDDSGPAAARSMPAGTPLRPKRANPGQNQSVAKANFRAGGGNDASLRAPAPVNTADFETVAPPPPPGTPRSGTPPPRSATPPPTKKSAPVPPRKGSRAVELHSMDSDTGSVGSQRTPPRVPSKRV